MLSGFVSVGFRQADVLYRINREAEESGRSDKSSVVGVGIDCRKTLGGAIVIGCDFGSDVPR